jgi:hypothetical protein
MDSATAGTPAQAGQSPDISDILNLNLKPRGIDQFLKAREAAVERLRGGNAGADGAPATGKAGYLYILTNPSLGNTIKVGKTRRNPRDRIDQLSSSTAIPTPFVLAFDAYVEDCDQAEAYVHSRLEKDG